MKVVIVNYGMGNIRSIISAVKYLEISDIVVSNEKSEIEKADKLILPGVGSFANAMKNILKLELDKVLNEAVIERKNQF